MSDKQFYRPNPESLLELLDQFIYAYDNKLYLPLKEDSKCCVLCLTPIEPGPDAIRVVEFLKARGIVKFSTYFHKSCLEFYKRRKKYLDACFSRQGYTFKDSLKNFRSHFEIYRSLKNKGIELLT
jgi:hypothetical protein